MKGRLTWWNSRPTESDPKIPESSKLRVFIVFVGGGTTPGYGLCMYEPLITHPHGFTLMTQPAVSTELDDSWLPLALSMVRGLGHDGKSLGTSISVTHI